MEYAINICSIILFMWEHPIRKKLHIQHGDLEAVLFIFTCWSWANFESFVWLCYEKIGQWQRWYCGTTYSLFTMFGSLRHLVLILTLLVTSDLQCNFPCSPSAEMLLEFWDDMAHYVRTKEKIKPTPKKPPPPLSSLLFKTFRNI